MLIWFRATSKITEESIKPCKIELEKGYDNATQNYQDDEEECELPESNDVCLPVKQNGEIIQAIRSNSAFARRNIPNNQMFLTSLFFGCSDNVNYQVGAVIVCQDKTTEIITKALFHI